MGLVPDQGDDHAVEVEEEQDEVEAELREGFLGIVSFGNSGFGARVPVPSCGHSAS